MRLYEDYTVYLTLKVKFGVLYAPQYREQAFETRSCVFKVRLQNDVSYRFLLSLASGYHIFPFRSVMRVISIIQIIIRPVKYI